MEEQQRPSSKDLPPKIEIDLTALPSERSRRCLLGCLAAILSTTAGTFRFKHKKSSSVDSDEDSYEVYSVLGEDLSSSQDEEDTDQTKASSSSLRSSQGKTQDMLRQRAREVNVSSLKSAGRALYLDPDIVAGFVPMLQGPGKDRSSPRTSPGSDDSSRWSSWMKSTTSSSQSPKSNNDDDDEEESDPLLSARENRTALCQPFLEELYNNHSSSSDLMILKLLALLLFRTLLPCLEQASKKIANIADNDSVEANARDITREAVAASMGGYDARVRTAYRFLAVELLAYGSLRNVPKGDSEDTMIRAKEKAYIAALYKFEALEDCVASYIVAVSKRAQRAADEQLSNDASSRTKNSSSTHASAKRRQDWVRAAKIGTAAAAAGAMFAFTGGLAAPAIAAGIAAVGAGTVITSSVVLAALTSTTAVTAIFGAGGGYIAACKMHRRTTGLTDFSMRKESAAADKKQDEKHDAATSERLTTNICISGWLRDAHDFQRPWGITPTCMDMTEDKFELLERFYAVYDKPKTFQVKTILEKWEGREEELWAILREQYGRDPASTLPIHGARQKSVLSSAERSVAGKVLEALGYQELVPSPNEVLSNTTDNTETNSVNLASGSLERELHHESSSESDASKKEAVSELARPDYAVYDFHSENGGDLYTISWEGDLILRLSNSAKQFAQKYVMKKAAKEVIETTALHVLISAVALPKTVLEAADFIDSDWTLACERADEAGVALAHALLDPSSGCRPVSLIGFRLGARIIYSCLKELGMLQIEWEKRRMQDAQSTFAVSSKPSTEKQASNLDLIIHREPASVVEDCVMMGLPYHLNNSSWETFRQVVSGRLVNCFAPRDLILLYLFNIKRLSSEVLLPVCGTTPVSVPGVENYDVEGTVKWYGDYCGYAGEVLRMIKFGLPEDLKKRGTAGSRNTTNLDHPDEMIASESTYR